MANRIVTAEFGGGLLRLYQDGSIQRRHKIPVPCSNGAFVDGVASTDVTLDDTTGVWVRLYLPNNDVDVRLPIVVYFHGGGFCSGSPSNGEIHSFCCRMSVITRSIWVSVAYRLGPEHRLPAGCEDCIEAIAWLNRVARREVIEAMWLSRQGDFESCFLAGESAGANMVQQVALSISDVGRGGQGPVKIIGMILLHPSFSKEERRRSEMDNPPDLALLPSDTVDQVAKLALPEGSSNRNYYIFNPWIPHMNQVVLPPALVTTGKLDIFYDTAVDYCRAMKAAGQDIELVEYGNMGHCFHLRRKYEASPEAFDQTHKVVNFMSKRLQILQSPKAFSSM